MLESLLKIPIYIPLTLHCLLGIIAATIAYKKGYSLTSWTVIGLLGGTFALVTAVGMKRK